MSAPEERRRHPRVRRNAVAVAVTVASLTLGGAAAAAAADPPVVRFDEDLRFDRPEAWAMKYFASVALDTGFGVPRSRAAGSVEAGLEIGHIPRLDPDEVRVGFRGSKQEDLNKAPVLARPRVEVGLGGGWSGGVAWVPPARLFDARAQLASLWLARPLVERRRWRLGARLHGTAGSIESDITCPDEVAARPPGEGNPLACRAPSQDRVTLRTVGVEVLAGAGEPQVRRLLPYLALGADRLDLGFRVDALTGEVRDRSRLTADGVVWHVAAGVGYELSPRLRVDGQVFYSPLSVRRPGEARTGDDPLVNGRLLLAYRVR